MVKMAAFQDGKFIQGRSLCVLSLCWPEGQVMLRHVQMEGLNTHQFFRQNLNAVCVQRPRFHSTQQGVFALKQTYLTGESFNFIFI